MTKQYLKKTALITVLIVTMLLPMVAFADDTIIADTQENGIMPCMTYIVQWKNGLDISDGTATVDCWVKGDVLDATKTKVIAELQLKSGNNWMAYGTWTNTENAFKASVYETKAVTDGYTYRVKATFTVWEGSQSEQIVVYTDEVTA